MSNPFADPESLLRYGLRTKDVKEMVSPRAPPRKPVTTPPTPLPPGTVTGFSLEKIAYGYRMHNVAHRGKIYDMDVSETLLPGDRQNTPAYHDQDAWLLHEDYRKIGTTTFDIPSGPEYASMIVALYRHQNTTAPTQRKLFDDLKGLLASDFATYWMMTSTRTTYTPRGEDVVEHCRGRAFDHYTAKGAVAGSSVQLQASMSLETKTWLGVENVQEFLDATTWLTGKDTSWLYRCTKEKKAFERALVLGVDNDSGFDINANDYVNVRPARGVAVREKISP